jgi:hypothetical protein
MPTIYIRNIIDTFTHGYAQFGITKPSIQWRPSRCPNGIGCGRVHLWRIPLATEPILQQWELASRGVKANNWLEKECQQVETSGKKVEQMEEQFERMAK